MKSTSQLLNELASNIPFANKIDPSISASSVGWHIDHNVMVINQIAGAVKASDPKAYQWSFNMKRLVVFTTGKIPRGKAKAPKSVIPENAFDENDVREKMEKANQQLAMLNELPSNHFFIHPFFGHLNVKNTKKMIALHTDHHLAIIKDIVASSK
jgi:hypothetical protein